MEYRNAKLEDIKKVMELQKKYHISTISDEDKADGFVTTLFTEEQFKRLIEEENGLAIASDGDRIVGYAMAASWEYWSEWPLFQHMISDLSNNTYLGQVLTTENSYQYGPIAIDKDYRGTSALPSLFDYSRSTMEDRYPILITFINKINPRSLEAHVRKLGLDIIKEFQFNNNNYYELAYDTKIKTKASVL